MSDKTMKVAPPIPDTFSKVVIATFVTGFYLFLVGTLGVETYHELKNHRPGTPTFDPRQTSPEAQKALFSLKD